MFTHTLNTSTLQIRLNDKNNFMYYYALTSIMYNDTI